MKIVRQNKTTKANKLCVFVGNNAKFSEIGCIKQQFVFLTASAMQRINKKYLRCDMVTNQYLKKKMIGIRSVIKYQ